MKGPREHWESTHRYEVYFGLKQGKLPVQASAERYGASVQEEQQGSKAINNLSLNHREEGFGRRDQEYSWKGNFQKSVGDWTEINAQLLPGNESSLQVGWDRT
jgi:hypothetical protein